MYIYIYILQADYIYQKPKMSALHPFFKELNSSKHVTSERFSAANAARLATEVVDPTLPNWRVFCWPKKIHVP